MKTIAGIALALALCAASGLARQSGGGVMSALKVSTPAFAPGGEIPAQYTCKGTDQSPPFAWSGAPAKTAAFALIMDDPDAPSGTWVHWVVWNVPSSLNSMPQGVPRTERLDNGAIQGRNSFHKIGYNGPCPPAGATHHYVIRLFALDGNLDLAPGANRSQLDAAMNGHVLAQAEYMGTFHR
jgi:Raf kinase inhibitor-like YbhB/YbcL family protein